MGEAWVAVLSAVVGGAMGYLAHLLQSRVPTKDNQDTLDHARRAEVLDHMRWSMELMVSEDPAKRRLGAGQLVAIASSPYLEDEDKRRIRGAASAALAPRLAPWDTEALVRSEEGEQS